MVREVTFCFDIENLLKCPPSPSGDDVIYKQPLNLWETSFIQLQNFQDECSLTLSPIQTVEEIARSGPGACSKEEKRECWSSFNPLQLFLPLKYKVTENLEIDKLDWQPVDKTVLLL